MDTPPPIIANNDVELAALKSRIDMLKIVYVVFFGTSIVLIVLQATNTFLGPQSVILWAVTLGCAVATRLYRNSLINKYNAARGGPIV